MNRKLIQQLDVTEANISSNDLLILSQNTLETLDINLQDVLEIVRDAYIGLRQGSDNPKKTIVQPTDQHSIAYSMVGRDCISKTVGFKVVYEFDPQRNLDQYHFHSFIFLCDDITGKPLAIMDVVKLGPLRTSATSALMAKAACPNAKTALVVGTGIQGQMALPMLVTAMPQLEILQIYGHYEAGIHAAQNNLKKYFPDREIEIVQSLEHAAKHADIIIGVAGSSVTEQVHYQWMKKQSIAILVGYGIDADVFQQADCLITTDTEQMKVTCNDLLADDGVIPPVYAELPDILLDKASARETADDIVFAYNSGMVVTDIALGRYLADKAIEAANIGQRVALW